MFFEEGRGEGEEFGETEEFLSELIVDSDCLLDALVSKGLAAQDSL